MKPTPRIVFIGGLTLVAIAGFSGLLKEKAQITNAELSASSSSAEKNVQATSVSLTPEATVAPSLPKLLEVPFVPEAPDGNWTGPWKDACEESSLAMIENFYKGNKEVTVADAQKFMSGLFLFQDKLYHSNMNSSAAHLIKMIDEKTSFGGTIITNPAINDIKKEIDLGHPVLSLHRGSDLKNKNIAFLSSGSSYHVLVVTGYDDATGEFITNDPGDRKDGKDHRYGYDLFMKSLHDYDYSNYSTDGPPRIVVTYPKN